MISSLTNQDYTLRLKAAFQMFLLTVMGLVLGTFYVLGALTLSIEDAANPPGSLYGVWSLFISFMGIFGIGAMTWTGSFLNKGVVPKPGETLPFMMTKTGRMKFIFLISSVLLSSLVVSGYSVSISSAFLLFCSASPFGMGLYTRELFILFPALVFVVLKVSVGLYLHVY